MATEGTELADLDGIGNTYEKKLLDCDITNINDLANATREDLLDAGLGETVADRVLDQAQKIGVSIPEFETLDKEQRDLEHVKTGVTGFDNILGGGLYPGFITGISGEPKAGKTQFIFQSLVSAVRQTGNPAIYIETEPGRFQTKRIREIAGDNPDIYTKIYRIKAYSEHEDVDSLDKQVQAYKAVLQSFDEVSIVAVDSFIANFRMSDRFQGRADYKERSNEITRHLRIIQSIGSKKECPVLMTLQVMGNPDTYSKGKTITYGGQFLHHSITCFIRVTHSKGELRKLSLDGHPSQPDGTIEVKLTSNGIEES